MHAQAACLIDVGDQILVNQVIELIQAFKTKIDGLQDIDAIACSQHVQRIKWLMQGLLTIEGVYQLFRG